MLVNIVRSYRDIVAICDSELLGKYFEEGNFQLDIKESFYKGDTLKGIPLQGTRTCKQASKKTEQEVIQIILDMKSEDATFNIVGERSVNCAVKAGLIIQEQIKTIQGIPFVLILL